MTSKYPGTCRKCGVSVQRGDVIGYHGRGAGITCRKCSGIPADRDPDAIVAPCWECKAPEGKFRCYGAATPVYCDACETRVRLTTTRRRPAGDWSDMAYEDACAAACGPGL